MGLYEGRGNLTKGMKDLMLRWQSTRSNWNDVVAKQFEETYLEPLETSLRAAVSAMDQMAQTLSRVDRDCK
ncbi:MAG TPA: hypothetical protein VF624_18980 [Tepidisphaeraceae bacterium]|jgi:hypothetical protein